MHQIVLILHNIRSCHNVGALLRTADGFGVSAVYMTGYTPYPASANDPRMPHLARKINAQIHKTALGAEQTTKWQHREEIDPLINELRKAGFVISALEQNKNAIGLPTFLPHQNVALIVGREVDGIEDKVLANCDSIVEIPMFGHKESFNVSAAAAIALYHLKFAN